jgi:predicted molibdopterin-dependent oxidoreductase YjgC
LLIPNPPAILSHSVLNPEKVESMKRKKPQVGYARLTHPLVRENGSLRQSSWDEALDRAAEGFRRNLAAKGANAAGIFSCSKSSNEVNFLASKLARVAFGNNNIDSCNRT